MAANPRGSMRPNGRSPPFLAIGLFVALVILGFNYWSLSARSGEQSNEIALMESELRLVNAKKTSSEKRGEALSDKVADLEKEISSQKEIISNKMAELQNVKQEKEECAQKLNDIESEKVQLREKLDGCEVEKNTLASEVEQLKGDAENLKNKPCDASACEKYSKLSREQTLREINQVAGNSPLIALYKGGGDVGQFAAELKELAEAQNNVPIQGGANIPQGENQQPQQPAVVDPPQGQNDLSQKDAENKDNVVVSQAGDEKDADGETGEGVQVGQVARPDVELPDETNHKGPSNSTATTPKERYTTKRAERGNQTANIWESSTRSSVANNAFTNSSNGEGGDNAEEGRLFPPDAGDGSKADVGDNEDAYDDEDDDNEDLDDALRLNADGQGDEDYDYDDDDDTDDYRYNDNLDNQENKEVNNNDNTIDEMFQRDKDLEQQ